MSKRMMIVMTMLIGLLAAYINSEVISAESWQQVLSKSENLEGYYYKTPYKFSERNMGVIEVWHQGYASRLEMTNSLTGETMILLTRQTDGTFYQIDPEANEAIAYTYTDIELLPQDLDESRYAVAGSRFDQNFIDRVSSVEEVDYRNQPVYLLENKSTHGGQEEIYRVWMSKEFGLPLKEEMQMADGRIHRRIYTDMKEGPFPQELFVLPEGLNIIREMRFN